METKEYAGQDHEIHDDNLKARSAAENKRKPEPKNKARLPKNKHERRQHENSVGI